MNKVIYTVLVILILLLVAGGIYYSNKVNSLQKALDNTIELVADTIMTTPDLISTTSAVINSKDGVLIPKIIYRDTGSFKLVPIVSYDTIREIDTIKVLVDYYSLKTYRDSIESQDVKIIIVDTLQKNSIFARQYSVTNLRTEDFFKKRMVYIGGTVGFNNQFMIGPSVSYLDKKNNSFGLNYLFSPNNEKTLLLNYSKKIVFKK